MENKVKRIHNAFEKPTKAVYTILWMTVISFLYLISTTLPSKIALKTQRFMAEGYYRTYTKIFCPLRCCSRPPLYSQISLKAPNKETIA